MSQVTDSNPTIKDQTISDSSQLKSKAFAELESSIYAALETYSNVHRGSGHFSLVTTHLYEKSREIVLEYLNLDKKKYVVIFCTHARSLVFKALLQANTFYELTDKDTGLPLGVVAIAVQKQRLPEGVPFETGGGTTLLASRKWALWADAPDKFEAGTPAIINVIAFAKALKLIGKYGADIFKNHATEKCTVFELLYHSEYDECSGIDLLKELQNHTIGNNVKVPTADGERRFINMDHSASTPAFEPVWQTWYKMLKQPRETQDLIINEVKAICTSFLNANPDEYEVIFTSNTTESVNLIAKNLRSIAHPISEPVVVNSFSAHSSNDLPWRYIPGGSLLRIDVNEGGFYDLDALEKLLTEYNRDKKYGEKRIKLVSVSGASNVLGICNDLKMMGTLVKKYDALFMIDAAQLVAHKKIDMTECNLDLLVFSAHKIYAPFGTGVIVARKGIIKESESIVENAPGIAALGKSLLLLKKVGMEIVEEHELSLTRKAIQGMTSIPVMRVFGLKDPSSPEFQSKIGVIPFTFTNYFANTISKQLALFGAIGSRFGCHCAHNIVKRLAKLNPFLEEIQKMTITLFPKMKLPGVSRISFGIDTTDEDIDHLLKTLKLISQKNKADLAKLPAVEEEINTFIRAREAKVF